MHHSMFLLLFFTHLALTSYMTGVIWLIQLLTYPAFHLTEDHNFKIFHKHHINRIKLVVLIPMIAELITATLLFFYTKPVLKVLLLSNLALLITIWFSTFLVQVPLHNTLSKGKETGTIQKLIQTNWFRTIFWSTRSVLLLYICYTLTL